MQVNPLNDAGRSKEPMVCVPSANNAMEAATAAADPELDPPGVCSRFQGLRVAGSPPRKANSVVVVFPSKIAPATVKLSIMAAFFAGTYSGSTWDPPVVGTPAT